MSRKDDLLQNNTNNHINSTECLSTQINVDSKIEEFIKLIGNDKYNIFILNLNRYEKSDIENSSIIYKSNSAPLIKELQKKQQFFLSHLYTDTPKEFNQIYFAKQLSYYMTNGNNYLSQFHGININKDGNYFYPIVLTHRPVNGPLPNKLKNLTLEQKYVIISEIIQGISYIHKENLIHSNFNPTTVYLNEDYQAVICDYIFIPQFEVETNKSEDDHFKFKIIEKEKVHSIFKNRQYVAPEIFESGELSSKSDIYNLGLTIFYILAEKEATFSEIGKIEYPTDFPHSFKKMIDACTSADPNKRPTANEMLDTILDDEQITNFLSSNISEKTILLLKNIKLCRYDEIDIIHKMIPNINEIDSETKLIISTAEKGDLKCIEKVGDFFHTGQTNLIQDDENAFQCYKFAAGEGSLYSMLQVAQSYETGIGVDINFKESLRYYELALKNMNENDPERVRIQSKIDELKYKSSTIILSNIPLNMSEKSIKRLLNKFSFEIVQVEKKEKFQKMTIHFSNFEDIAKARRMTAKYKFRFEYVYKKNIIRHRFDMLYKYLPKINIYELNYGIGNDSFIMLNEDSYYQYYLVYKNYTEEPFTAKVFFEEIDNRNKNNIKKEIIIVSKFNHPAILRNIGFSETNLVYQMEKSKDLTIFTEFMPRNLEDVISKSPEQLTDTNKLKIIIGIASGLLEMYNKNIVHRDLNSQNISLNENFEPVIYNFFLSSHVGDKCTNLIGTPVYMAPELYNSNLNIYNSYKIDSYSFGIILYQILVEVVSLKVYKKVNAYQLMYYKFKNWVPDLPTNLHNVFRYLIKSCWNTAIDERPDPQTICDTLIEAFNSSDPLLPNVDRSEVEKYINKLKFYQDETNETNETNIYDKIRYLMHLLKLNDPVAPYQLCSIFYEGKYLSTYFKAIEKIKLGELGEIHLFENEETKEKIIGKILFVRLYNYSEKEAIQIMTNLSIVLQLNHSCICKCLGFYPYGFHEEKCPIIFYEYMKNGSLFDIINHGKVEDWNDTKKLINIYGIALGMSYLHSHDILHQDLNTKNILADDQFYPKIKNCCLSKIFNTTQTTSKIISISPFNAPEIFIKNEYTKASEVYSFGMIVYSIITNQNPDQNCSKYQTFSKIIEGDFLQTKESIPEVYLNLINKCLSPNPEDRPTFNDILDELRSNREFLSESIDVEQYNKYIEYTKTFSNNDGLIEPCPVSIIKEWLKNKQVDDLFLFEHEQNESNNDEEEEEEEYIDEKEMTLPFFDNINTLQLKNLKQIKFIKEGGFGLVYKVQDKITKAEYAAKVLKMEEKSILDYQDSPVAINFTREVLCHSQAKNEAITKFIGYNRHYFHRNPKPVIFTEFINKGDLNSILKRERVGESIENWNDTQKLIVIYGIAYGMSYLHSIGILFRDLNPSNVLLDDSLFPKICDFGLSKNISEKDYSDKLKEIIEKNHVIDNKSSAFGTKGFIAPEIYINSDYSKASDVYAFAILVYEIVTSKNPYEVLSDQQVMYQITIQRKHPIFFDGIDENYKNLIESCWDDDPQKRPTFENIVKDLRDPKYLTKNVDPKAFNDYVDSLQKK